MLTFAFWTNINQLSSNQLSATPRVPWPKTRIQLDPSDHQHLARRLHTKPVRTCNSLAGARLAQDFVKLAFHHECAHSLLHEGPASARDRLTARAAQVTTCHEPHSLQLVQADTFTHLLDLPVGSAGRIPQRVVVHSS
jgi:hypothetical protein